MTGRAGIALLSELTLVTLDLPKVGHGVHILSQAVSTRVWTELGSSCGHGNPGLPSVEGPQWSPPVPLSSSEGKMCHLMAVALKSDHSVTSTSLRGQG